MTGSTSLQHFVQHYPVSSAVRAASPGSLSTGASATLSMYCTGCTSAVFIATGSSPFGRASRSSVSAQRLLTIVHLWNLDSLLRILNLVFVAFVGNVDQVVFLRRGDVSGVRLSWLPTSPHCGMRVHPLWVRSFHPLWVRSFHPLWVRSGRRGFTRQPEGENAHI